MLGLQILPRLEIILSFHCFSPATCFVCFRYFCLSTKYKAKAKSHFPLPFSLAYNSASPYSLHLAKVLLVSLTYMHWLYPAAKHPCPCSLIPCTLLLSWTLLCRDVLNTFVQVGWLMIRQNAGSLLKLAGFK